MEKLTHFKIFLQVHATMMIEKKKLKRFLKDGHEFNFYYELKNNFLWRRALDDLHAFDEACDRINEEIGKNINVRKEELLMLSPFQAHKSIVWMEGPLGWTAWVYVYIDVFH